MHPDNTYPAAQGLNENAWHAVLRPIAVPPTGSELLSKALEPSLSGVSQKLSDLLSCDVALAGLTPFETSQHAAAISDFSIAIPCQSLGSAAILSVERTDLEFVLKRAFGDLAAERIDRTGGSKATSLLQRFAGLLLSDLCQPLLTSLKELTNDQDLTAPATLTKVNAPQFYAHTHKGMRLTFDLASTSVDYILLVPIDWISKRTTSPDNKSSIERSSAWRKDVEAFLQDTIVPLTASLPAVPMTLQTVSGLRTGDVIQLQSRAEDLVTLSTQGTVIHQGQLGQLNDKLCVRLKTPPKELK